MLKTLRSLAAKNGQRTRVLPVLTLLGLGLSLAQAQTTAPILMPNTFSTVAGGAGTVCTGKTDVYGDGCPATQAILGFDLFAGVVVDGQGNLYIDDANNYVTGTQLELLRRVDARSGIISTVISSGNTLCMAGTVASLGSTSSLGDGCPFASAKFNKERGIGIDPYGNVLSAGYGNSDVRILCNAVSPLCPVPAGVQQGYATAQKQVGYVYRIAGCVGTVNGTPAANNVTTAPGAGDGYFASPFQNLPGDVAAWGTSNGSFSSTATTVGTGGTCGVATTGGVDAPRGVAADIYGNVYIADTTNKRYRVVVGPPSYTLANGNVLTNPLPAILRTYATYASVTAAQMYGRIYPIMGGYTSPTMGGTCGGNTAKDTYGDNCPFYQTSTSGSTSASALGMTISATGDLVVVDASARLLRVLYMGATVYGTTALQALTPASNPMAYAIYKNNNTLTSINQGYVYVLAGGGAAGYSATPTLGTSTILGSNTYRVATAPNGNFFLTNSAASTTSDIEFYDLSTGYVREIATSTGATSGTSIALGGDSATTIYYCPTPGTGDGTAAATSAGLSTTACFNSNGGGSGSMGIAVDAANNIYITDTETNSTGSSSFSRIRKIAAGQLSAPLATGSSATALGSTTTGTLRIHAPAGYLTSSGTSVISSTYEAAPGLSIAAPVCGSGATDSTVECYAATSFTPTEPGVATAQLELAPNSATIGIGTTVTAANFPLTGLASGSALVADSRALGPPSNSSVIYTGGMPNGLALDAAGNVYTVDTTLNQFDKVSGGVATALSGTPPANLTQLAVDLAGNLYAAATGAASLTKLTLSTTGSYTAGTLSITGVAAPQAVAFDQQGNLFVADKATGSVYEVAAATLTTGASLAYQPLTTVAIGLNNPTSLALDGNGDVFIGDPGAGALYKVSGGTITTLASSVTPVEVAADTGGNVYYQDRNTEEIYEIPASGPASVTVYGLQLMMASGLAVAPGGNLYSADAGAGTLTLVARNALTYGFGTSASAIFGATISNAGNLASSGLTATDPTEFPITTGQSNGCGSITSSSNTTIALAPGAACTLTSMFVTAAGSASVSSTNYFANTAQAGFFRLTGTEGGTVAPTTTLSLATTPTAGVTSASYSAGTELTYALTVTASDSSTPTGSVSVIVTNTTTAATVATATVPLSGGMATYIVSGLSPISGTYTISASYSGAGYQASNTPTASFSITQLATSVSWTPTHTSQAYSQAIGNVGGVLNATATVPGTFVYTATSGTTTRNIHSASYLPIGSYTLGVTFYPTDSVDYASSSYTGSSINYSVTQASTTAGFGVTQNLVAADGTGNYTTVQAAVNALPSGGSVYIKPGTYNGFVTVVQPNIALRGLGGNPAAVILTNEAGAFGQSSYPYIGSSGLFSQQDANGYQLGGSSSIFSGDEGSATLVVAKGINTNLGSSATQTPAGFFAEYLTIANTYDTDTTTTTTTYESTANGSCVTGQSTPQTLSYLYNNQFLCASQALAIWITGDQAVMNNVYAASLQDTIYAGSVGSSGSVYTPARQYWFRGKITGDVDYIFGDAAAAFDSTTIYSAYHSTNTGTVTIEAQSKAQQTGSTNDYLSGYIMNNVVFTSQQSGMTNLYLGRPYVSSGSVSYSTWVMLNSYVDQVIAAGYTLGPNSIPLTQSTYLEYGDIPYADPATNGTDLNGITYVGPGGQTAALAATGVNGTRETASTNPGTAEASNTPPTSLSQAQAQAYFPTAFLSQTVPSTITSWIPTTALASGVNAFTSGATVTSVATDSSVTLLMRPQTPGLGAIPPTSYSAASPTPTVFTVPTGTYSLSDTYNGTTAVIASGTLDASGEAYFTTSSLGSGSHSLVWTYSGDTNFAGSTSSAYALTVTGTSSTAVLSAPTVTYGQSATVTETVTAAGSGATPTGSVSITINGTTLQTTTLNGSGVATFTVPNLTAGTYTIASNSFAASSTTLTVNPAPLTITGVCANRVYGAPNVCSTPTVSTYQYTDSAATVFSGTLSSTTPTLRNSVAGIYAVTPVYTLTAFGSTNYAVTTAGSYAISGGAVQKVIFKALPNFPSGSFQLTAHATSGLPVTYSVMGAGASISGSVLTLSGASGNMITVTASQTVDPAGDYAPATSVSQSFTAQ